MPQRPTQQHQQLASPEPYPSSIVGGGSTPTKHPKPTFTATTFSHYPTPPNPDLIQPSKPSSFILKHLSSLNIISHKPRAPHKPSQTNNNNHPPQPPLPPPTPPPLVDTHLLQVKAVASSAIVATAPKLIAKRPSKEKPQKCKKEVERRKLEGVMKKGSDGGVHHGKVLFEEDDVVKVENSRVPPPVVVEEKHHDVVVKRHSVSLSQAPPPPPPSGGGGGGNRRRSFCGSKVVDLGDVFAVNGVKVVSADMPPFMQIHAVDCARKAFDSMEKFTSKTLALTLKKEFDGVYGPAWHCIVGTNFGSFVTHSVGGFLYFSMDQKLYILLFKTAVLKAG